MVKSKFIAYIFDSKNNFTKHVVFATNEEFKIKTKDVDGNKVQQVYFIKHDKVRYTWHGFLNFRKKLPCSFYNENNPEPLDHKFVSEKLKGEDWNRMMDAHVISELFRPVTKEWLIWISIIISGMCMMAIIYLIIQIQKIVPK